jgi:hypothetical protein
VWTAEKPGGWRGRTESGLVAVVTGGKVRRAVNGVGRAKQVRLWVSCFGLDLDLDSPGSLIASGGGGGGSFEGIGRPDGVTDGLVC